MNKYGVIPLATGLQINICRNQNTHLISILVFILKLLEHFNTSFQMYGHITAAQEKVVCIRSLYTAFSN